MFKLLGFEKKSGYVTNEQTGEAIYWSNFEVSIITNQVLGTAAGSFVALNRFKTIHLLNFFGIYKGSRLPASEDECNVLEEKLSEHMCTMLDQEIAIVSAAVTNGKVKELMYVGFRPVENKN